MTFDKWSLNLVNIMNREGVKIIAGTDTPIGYLTPGFSLHKELELLSEAGMTNKEVLHSATIAPAEFLNIQNEIGTIEEGKLADLVILNQNPLESIKNTQDIYLVIAKGIVQ
jgi:imidazolonepropionase-like amidohydrolase